MEYTKVFFEKVFSTTPGLMELNKYISTAKKQIAARGEDITTAKITAELTWGFWTSLFNRNYERILWKDLRRAFPFVKKANRQRKIVASFLNKFRRLRNRIDHNEAICWNLDEVEMIHEEMMNVVGWMNKEVPTWLSQFDRFSSVSLLTNCRAQLIFCKDTLFFWKMQGFSGKCLKVRR